MTKIDLAKECVERHIEIALKTKTQISKRYIATVLTTEHPEKFKNVEDARTYIRTVTGSNPIHRKTPTPHIDLARRFALIPAAIKETSTTEPFIVPTNVHRTLWMADIHGRFYDRKAFETAIEYGVKKNCDSVIINGDFLDFYQHSKFDKNPQTSILMDEREWAQDVLKLLQDVFGYVVLKEGNHDSRREAHIARLASTMPELMDLSKYSDFCFFDGCRVNFVEDYRHICYGKLNAFHGHEYYGGGGIHVAYNRFHKALDNILTAHSHKSQSIIKPNINGHIYGSWALGCLCELHPRYSSKNDWNQGFAVTEKNADGDFEVDNRIIYKDKTFPS